MSETGKARARPTLSYAACVVLVIALGAILRASALESGFFSDDFVQAAMLEGQYASPRGPLDLFAFADGTAEDRARLMRVGALPWWAADDLRLSMLRPLSSALVNADRALLGDDAFAYHLHSLAWWLFLVVVSARLLRELFGPTVAGLALFLFVLEEGHTLPLAWLANRGALLSMGFGALALLLHIRGRRAPATAPLAWAAVCWALSLLAGEWAFPMLGYVVAYELCERRDAWGTRALSLAPSLGLGAAFVGLRGVLGYGVRASGVYIDPVSEPARFIFAACQRVPVFFADLVFSVPANWWGLGTPWRDRVLALGVFSPEVWLALPGWRFWHVTLGVLAMCVLGVSLILVRRASPEMTVSARFLMVGAFLSLLPVVGSFPTSRLVLPASLGVATLFALVLQACATRLRAAVKPSRAHALGSVATIAFIAYFQVWQAGSTSWHESRFTKYAYASVREWALGAQLDDATVQTQHVFLVSSLEHTTTIFLPFVRSFFGHPQPASTQVLSAAPHAHDVYRPKANVLELSALAGGMLESEVAQLYRADRFPFHPGQRARHGVLDVQVLRTLAGQPQSVRFTFEHPLEHPSYVFLEASPAGLVRARLPEVGQTVRYRRASMPDAVTQDVARLLRDPSVTCSGSRPPIDECRVGAFFADCGGSGAPIFACHGLGDCRFFTSACVAEGYETSPCVEGAACCVNGSPFYTDGFSAHPPYSRVVRMGFGAWGQRARGLAHDFDLPVFVAPELSPLRTRVFCQGDAGRGPCDLAVAEVATPQRASLHFVLSAPSRADWALSVEVIDDPSGVTRARVCRIPTNEDMSLLGARDVCDAYGEPLCATSGEVRLSHFPLEPARAAELRARVVAEFEDGVQIEAEL